MTPTYERLFGRGRPTAWQQLCWGMVLGLSLAAAGFGLYAQYVERSGGRYYWLAPVGLAASTLGQLVGANRRALHVVLLSLGLVSIIAGLVVALFNFHRRFGVWI